MEKLSNSAVPNGLNHTMADDSPCDSPSIEGPNNVNPAKQYGDDVVGDNDAAESDPPGGTDRHPGDSPSGNIFGGSSEEDEIDGDGGTDDEDVGSDEELANNDDEETGEEMGSDDEDASDEDDEKASRRSSVLTDDSTTELDLELLKNYTPLSFKKPFMLVKPANLMAWTSIGVAARRLRRTPPLDEYIVVGESVQREVDPWSNFRMRRMSPLLL